MIIYSEYSLKDLLKAREIKFIESISPTSYTYVLDGKTTVNDIYTLIGVLTETTLTISDFNLITLTVKINFDMFMDEVDESLQKQCGLCSNSLPDYDWMAEFESNVEPQEAVSEFLLTTDSL